MTYSIKVTPFAAAMLDGYCRAAGSSLKTTLGHHLTQQAPTRVADHAAATLAAASAEQPLGALPSHSQAAAEPPAAATKRGVLLLARGGSGSDEGAVRAAKMIFSCVGVDPARISIVCSASTDTTPAASDCAALAAARAAGAFKN